MWQSKVGNTPTGLSISPTAFPPLAQFLLFFDLCFLLVLGCFDSLFLTFYEISAWDFDCAGVALLDGDGRDGRATLWGGRFGVCVSIARCQAVSLRPLVPRAEQL